MTRRTDRVEDLLRQEISTIILREVGDPRIRMVTVAGIDVSADLRHAEVRVSVMAEEEARAECMTGLRSARGFIRKKLADRVRMKVIPELEFVLDRGAEHSIRIAEILETLHHDDDEQSS